MKQVKEILKNATGKLVVKYTIYMDGEKFQVSRHDAWLDNNGDVQHDEKPSWSKYY